MSATAVNYNAPATRRCPQTPAVGHAPYRLTEAILSLSAADTWRLARREWALVQVFFQRDPPGRCLCGHHPIVEHCRLANRVTGHQVLVGNCCVRKFLGLPTGAIFSALRRIAADPGRPMSAALIEHARDHGWVNAWECSFLVNTAGSRRLSERQRVMRVEINTRVLRLVGGRTHA